MVGWLQWADCSGSGSKEVVMMMKVASCRILGARNQSSVRKKELEVSSKSFKKNLFSPFSSLLCVCVCVCGRVTGTYNKINGRELFSKMPKIWEPIALVLELGGSKKPNPKA